MDKLTIKKRGIADKLREKLADKLHDPGLVGAPRGASDGAGSDHDEGHRHATRGSGRTRSAVTESAPPADSFSREPVDPLVDFLARYDDGDLEEDRGSGFVPTTPVEDEQRFLAFDLHGEAYAASIMDVREILKSSQLTEVPRAPASILGVLSKRGEVMPVIDLAASIGLRPPDQRTTLEQRILVVGDGDRVCGLRVDRVREVVRLSRAGIEDVPASLGSRQAHMLTGLGRAGDRMLILLDTAQVLDALAQQMGLPTSSELEASRVSAEAP